MKRHRFGVMVAALWWGSLTALGFVIVPMLFTHLASPQIAGAMAAKLFTAQTWLSTACAMLLFMVFNKGGQDAPPLHMRSTIKFILAGLLMTLLVEFAIAPRIISARADGGDLRLWHGLGSAMYFGQWICAGFALWRLSLRPVD
jgi:hypothetical protein